MKIIKAIFKSRDHPKNHQGDSVGGGRSFPFGRAWSGKSVTERTAMQTTAVYACVRIISETVASLPLHVYEYTDSGKERVFTHPLYRLLHDIPNPEMNSFVMREVMMSHLLLWGNSYSQIIRNGKGEVTALYPLMPEKMRIDRGADGRIYYTYNSDKQGTFVFRKDEVFHVVGLGFDGLVGYSPIAMAKNAIGLSIAAEEYGSSFFSNSGTPSGVLEHPGVLKEPEKVRDAWNDAYGGSSNAHKVAVLEEGMKFSPISINPHEAQFLETRKFQVNEICRIFRVPPHMIADLEKSSFNNIEQQSLDFVTNTIRPWLVRIEQSIFQQLLTEEEQQKYFVKFNVDGLLRGDFKSRMSGYAVGRQNGWYSANDIRELEDMNKIPAEEGGDRYLCNGNMVDIKNAGNGGKTEGSDEIEQVLEVQNG